MTIRVELDVLLSKKKMKACELAKKIGISEQNLSVLKNGHAKAIRFSTLDAICRVLDCEPGDVLAFRAAQRAPSVWSNKSTNG
jgi:putative transcriptional regulator